jgi:hypothetical protein
MSERKHTALWLVAGVLALSPTLAMADHTDTANATMNCSTYSLFVSASALSSGTQYTINFTIDISPGSAGFPITGSTGTFVAPPSGTFSETLTGSFPPLTGSFEFSGTATLMGQNTINISFSPTSLTCGTPPPPPCSAQSTNGSNFNGTSVPGGDYIWFNAHFRANGIPITGSTITFTNSTISFAQYNLTVPNAQITFSPSASCTSTTFNAMTGTWMTTVPISGDDEIFLTGLAWPVPGDGLPGGINPVDWEGTFGTNGTPGVSVQWQWGAAAYSSFTTDYNALNVKPGHQTACGMNNGDHAGTPEGVNNNNVPWKNFCVGGGTGGGSSGNPTGSWSGTLNVTPVCGGESETIFGNLVPQDSDIGQSGFELGTTFRSDIAGSITAIRYYGCGPAPADTTSSHIGHIWDSSGNQLVSVTFTNPPTATGWQQQALASPLLISANTTYTVSVNAQGCQAITVSTPDGASTAEQEIINGVLSGLSVYSNTPGTFPNIPAYWGFRDIVFIPN